MVDDISGCGAAIQGAKRGQRERERERAGEALQYTAPVEEDAVGALEGEDLGEGRVRVRVRACVCAYARAAHQ